ncbi:unnamed protein product [Clavelina lepadiformis]|uniref:G-protein coupled receptors family 1 profile domain-containing protein n=1 Tax=Clavelina lepadiformis TaxID=159417 RepID=A0ABP0GRH9_CLALP
MFYESITKSTSPPVVTLDKMRNQNGNHSMRCCFPGFCESNNVKIHDECFNKTFLDCQVCGETRGVVFLFLAVCLGLAILIGNGLTVLVGIRRCKRGKASKMDICRTSLAMADVLTSIQLLVIVTYNFSWSMSMTLNELENEQGTLRGSPLAYTAGLLFLFAITTSMYQLAYMAMERIYAIAKPYGYRWQSNKSVYVGVVMAWILPAIAIILTCFIQELTFSYSPMVFLYYPTPTELNQSSAIHLFYAVLYAVPYLLTTILIIGTGIMICRHRKIVGGMEEKSKNKTTKRLSLQRNTDALITIAIMQIAFSITALPTMIISSLLYTSQLDCATLSQPYLISFYFTLSNSLANVVIYNIRDKEFRDEMLHTVKPQFARKLLKWGTSNETTELQTKI